MNVFFALAVLTMGSSGRLEVNVEVFAPEQVPLHLTRFVPATNQPDLAACKKEMEAGREVPGAVLKARDRLTLKG